jgi:hypothetical protein
MAEAIVRQKMMRKYLCISSGRPFRRYSSSKVERGAAMKWIPPELSWSSLLAGAKGMGRGSYAIIAILLGLLIWTGILAGMGWSSAVGTEVPVAGYVAMAIGVVFSVLLGVGLMVLVFYSSRAGYDEPAKLIRSDGDKPRIARNKR